MMLILSMGFYPNRVFRPQLILADLTSLFLAIVTEMFAFRVVFFFRIGTYPISNVTEVESEVVDRCSTVSLSLI